MNTTTTNPSLEAATARVDSSETLSAYRDLLLDYDWPNTSDHLQWVAAAPEAEIVAWAQGVRADEAEAE